MTTDTVDPQPPTFLLAEELAEQLRLDVQSIYRLARSRQIASVRIGRKVRFTPAALAEYVARQTRAALN
jgi:excisionase family DNA binding protein